MAAAPNCCVAPLSTFALAGDTETEVSVFVGFCTVRVAVPLIPLNDAVIADEPGATPVAKPLELMVATV
jgi:hypothetical protein